MNAWLCFLLTCCCALNWARAEGSEPAKRAEESELDRRQTNRFARTWLFKPTEPAVADMGFTLAPLILQELSTRGTEEADGARFGRLALSNGVPVIEFGRPAVYLETDSVEINGTPHLRFAYFWFYAAEAIPGRPSPLPFQGVRITLDSGGKPAIWEVLAEPSDTRRLFVAQHIEAAALKENGRPFQGRRYAVERNLQECPKVVVARVIEDGPIPMGPIIYLEKGTRSVVTLICRCMPAEADQVVGTSNYELISTASPVDQVLGRLAEAGWKTGLGSSPDGREPSLNNLLRLPRSL